MRLSVTMPPPLWFRMRFSGALAWQMLESELRLAGTGHRVDQFSSRSGYRLEIKAHLIPAKRDEYAC
jgi:hypothetical protein